MAKFQIILVKKKTNFAEHRFIRTKRRFNFGKKHEKGDKILYYPHKVIYCVIAIRLHKIYIKSSGF
ncbi:MAG: hypothetical protein LBO06_02730, partial [Bacteroidales bacterium]|nr:hypothetical protein [Bacteroidales bacterium]